MAVTVTHPFVSAIADDPTAAGNGEVLPSHWNASHTLSGLGTAAESAATDFVAVAGDTMTGTLTSTLGTITADQQNWTGTATWNSGATTFTAMKLNVTDTASNAASLLADWQVGGISMFSVRKDGVVFFRNGLFGIPGTSFPISFVANGGGLNGVYIGTNSRFAFTVDAESTSAVDVAFTRNAAGVVEVNNGTAGTFRDLITRYVATNPTTVASLPAAAAGNKGYRGFVTDSNATMTAGIGAVVAGGGTDNVPVYSDGTNWRIG